MRKFAQTIELIDKVLQNKGLELQVCCRAPTNEVYCLVIKDPGRPSALDEGPTRDTNPLPRVGSFSGFAARRERA